MDDERAEVETPPAPVRLTLGHLLRRGAARRCPRCGARHLFRRWVTMAERCPGCGLRFEREEGFALGVMTINIAATSALFTVYLVVGFVLTVPDPPVLGLTLGGIALCGLLPIVLYPFAKTLWLAIDLAMRPVEVAEAAEAVTYLAAPRVERVGEG